MKKLSLILLLSCLSMIVCTHSSYGTSYCTPAFYNPSAACYSLGMDISQYRIVGESGSVLNDVSACSGSGYEDMTSSSATMTVSLMQSVTYTATIACSGSFSMDCQVWIDFNNDGTFDASESVGGLNSYRSSTFSVTIPLSVATGTHRMRIVATQSGSYFPSMDPCAASYYYGDARDYIVHIVALPACSGTPTGGHAVSDLLVVCPSETFNLTDTGGTVAGGMTYQWQSSPDSSTWTNISGATSNTLSTTESATRYYRRVVTCTSSSSTSYSSGIKVYYIGYCYCTPSYTLPTYSCGTYGMDIANFHVIGESGSSINDNAACDGTGYLNRTSLYDTFMQSLSYTASISCSGSYAMNCQIWIDFSNDGTFDASESVGGANGYHASGTTFTMTMPFTATVGMHRARLVTVYGTSYTYPGLDPCPTYTYGEARDYTVYIVALPACSGTPAGGSATSTSFIVCPSDTFTVNVTGGTAASGMTFQWQSSSDSSTWTNISGATNFNYTAPESATLYYRRVTTCTSSGSSANSAGYKIYYIPYCYCVPYYSLASASCSSYGMDIQLDVTGESGSVINDVASCDGSGYLNRTVLLDTFKQSYTYTPTIACTGSYGMNAQTWIDFNDNGTFETTESVGGINGYTSSGATYSILIPITAHIGLHRMRVVASYSGSSYAYPGMNPCPSYTYGETRDYSVYIVPLPPCSGTPTGGSAFANVTLACPGSPFVLNDTSFSHASSLTFQWQSSSDTTTWTDISGATSIPYSYTTSAALYYRVLVTCTVSGTTTASSFVYVNYLGICFCHPVFRSGPTSCSLFTFAMSGTDFVGETPTAIHDTANCSTATIDSGYQDRTALSCSFMLTHTYNVTVSPSHGTLSGYTLSNQVWIDFNDNGTFEASETVSGQSSYSDGAPTTQTLTIPFAGHTGTHRMRIVQTYTGSGYTYPSIDPCVTGYTYGEARDYTVTIVPLPPCSGTPTAGTVATTSATACPGYNFTLSLTGSTVAGSLSWQWQSSTDSSTWTNIVGDTFLTMTDTETVSTYYRCIVKCTVSGDSVFTPGLLIPYFGYCYCVPTFPGGRLACSSYNFALSGFHTNGESSTSINDNVACDGTGYENHTGMSVSYMQSVSYLITVVPSTASTFGYELSNQIWIDFNDNGTFEASETVGGKTSFLGSSSTVDTVTMPLTATLGMHRMRIVECYTSYTYYYPSLPSCPSGTPYYGEARDYTVNIVPLPPCSGTPTAGTVTSSIPSTCLTTPFTLYLSGYTVAGSMAFQWQSSSDSATWSSISGATNTNLTTTESASRYYRCVVVCTISSDTVYSPGLLIPWVSYCYCTPSFSSASYSCGTYHFALDGLNVYGEFATSILDNAHCDGSGYRNMTALSVTLMNTLSYSTTVFPSTGGSTTFSYTLNNQIWIDFNDNGTFESSETVAGQNGYADNAPTLDTITIPAGAPTGNHRMRVVQVYSGSGYSYPSLDPCCSGYTYGEARDYTVYVTPLPPCSSGTPSPGTAISSVGTSCPGVSFTLTDYGYGMASGLTFQWQVSTDSVHWTNISGATTSTWSLTQTGPHYYQCIVTCSTTGAYAASIGVYVNYISYCYCTPSYTSGSLSCGSYHMSISRDYIAGAAGTMLNDTGACTSTCYENRTGLSVSFFQGTVYQDSLSTAYTAGTMCAQVWIDYNNDGTFAASESVGGYNNYSGHIVFNLTISSAAPLGPHRMRVVTAYAGSGYTYSTMDPCTYGYSLGDARDYTANIVIPGCTGTPTAGAASADDTSACAGYISHITCPGASTGTGITYQWQSSPDNTTWTNISGATSSTYTATVTTPTFYRAIITCATTSYSATSTSVHTTVTAPPTAIAGTYYTCSGSSSPLVWSSTPAGGTWSSASTSIATVNPTTGQIYGVATGTSVISYTLPSGCYVTRTVIVNPSPASITGTTSACVGSSAALYDGSTGGYWSSANPSVATVDPSTGIVTGVTAGSVSISYTLSTGCSVGTPSTAITFTVNPLPATITGITSLCVGYPSTLTSATAGGTWSSSATSIATIDPTSGAVTGLTAGGSATITYTLSGTGCKTTTGVTVNAVTVPTMTLSSSATTVCAGTPVTFTSTTTNGGTSPTYVWRVNGVILAGGTSYTYTPSNGDVVSLWFHSSATCAIPDSMTSSITMTVNPVVTPSVTTTTGVGDTVCLGTVVTLSATPFGGGTAPVYHWYVNGTPVGGTGSSYGYVPTNGDVVTVHLISNQVCRAADSGSFSRTLTVSPYVTPLVSVTSSLGPVVCAGATVNFTASGLYGGTAPTYQWLVGSTVVGASTSYAYMPTNGDTVKVILTSNFPCVTSSTASDQIVMTVLPSVTPVGVVTVSPGYIIAPGTTATFTCTITSGGGSAPTYQWTINGVPISGATNSTYSTSALFTGSVVTCIVANTDPCSNVSTFTGVTMTVSSTSTGVGNVNHGDANVTVLPNPNNGSFSIKGNLGANIDEPVTVEITNMLGQVIYTNNIKAVKGEIDQPITLSGKLADGMYILNVKSEHLSKVFHFVLEQ